MPGHNVSPDRGSPQHQSLRVPILEPILNWFATGRRWLSRSDWGRRILRRKSAEVDAHDGLILIQIDGLSRRQLEIALAQGTMPFLKRLIAREHYDLRTMYSGVPSTTAAVQGELFYGVRSPVPAHAFGDRSERRIVTMLDSERAKEVERRLQEAASGLLEGGSAFSNIYCGGAAHPHFCAAAMGWGDLFHNAHPGRVLAFLVMHVDTVLRIAGQAVVEFGLAIADCFRGLSDWKTFREAVKFLPSRVAVAVVLREAITVAAAIDASAGVPVIQLNYLGYDEHAHLRGPDSRFAHWTLRGIDRCIRRLWKAAARSNRRPYHVWIYSDHGQERVVPFDVKTGKLITDVVREAFGSCLPRNDRKLPPLGADPVTSRAAFLRSRPPTTCHEASAEALRSDDIVVAAVGPLGHIYLPGPAADRIDHRPLADACQALARRGEVPLVLMAGNAGEALAWTAEGSFQLPVDARRLFGARHPFLQSVAEDLVRVCHHPDAGDVVILGWRDGGEPLSFVYERGAHGGVSVQETQAFLLLPRHTFLEPADAECARPSDVRDAALRLLGRTKSGTTRARRRPPREHVRVMTYNVHSCVGLDGRLSLARIARILAECDADVIALQELDAQNARTGFGDQALELAGRLGMDVHFHPALSIAGEQYGDAVLSRLPMRLVRAAALPTIPFQPALEPRGALWAAVDCGSCELQLINTHLGLRPPERLAQIEELLGLRWLASPDCRGPAVLCGDFNAVPSSPVYRRITRTLRDAQRTLPGFRPRRTWCSPFPMLRIDHLFVNDEVGVAAVNVPASTMIRTASDHLPLVVDLVVSNRKKQSAIPDAPQSLCVG